MSRRRMVRWSMFGSCLLQFVLALCLCSHAVSQISGDTPEYKKYYDLALKLIQEHKSQEAEKVLVSGIDKYPAVAELYYLRGALYVDYYRDRYQDALMDFTMVIKLDPESMPKVYWRRGTCFYNIGEYELAVRDFTKCLKLLPGYAKVYYIRAQAYAKLGMFDKAKSDLVACARADPKYAAAADNLLRKFAEGGNDFGGPVESKDDR